MSMPDARDLLDLVAGYTDAPDAPKGSADKPVRFAIVDPAYNGTGRPKVTFDGEATMGTRTYVSIGRVAAGDRVVMLPAGRSYVILGAVDASPGSTFIPGQSVEGYWTAAPDGFYLEDGSVKLRADDPALFAAIGTTFNTGGETGLQFRLPDSRGRVAVNKATSGTFLTLGAKVGAETVAHVHTLTTAIAAIWVGFWKTRTGPVTWTATNSGGATAPGSSSSTSANGASLEGSTDSASPSVVQPSIVVLRVIKR